MFQKILLIGLFSMGCAFSNIAAQNNKKMTPRVEQAEDLGMEISPNKITNLRDTTKEDSLKIKIAASVPQQYNAVVARPTPTDFVETAQTVSNTPPDKETKVENAPPPVSEPILEATPQSLMPTLDPNPVEIAPPPSVDMVAKGAPEAVPMTMETVTIAPVPTEMVEKELTETEKMTTQPVEKAPETVENVVKFAEMTFENGVETFDFGRVRAGERPQHTFLFTNTGNEDLEIELVSACNCTTVEHTKSKIAPGATGYLQATFDSNHVLPEGANRLTEKDITIILKNVNPKSGYQIVKTLSFKAFVEQP